MAGFAILGVMVISPSTVFPAPMSHRVGLVRHHHDGANPESVTAVGREIEMQKKKIGYWVATGLLAFAFVSGGIADVVQPKPVVEGMTRIGYPLYFLTIIGLWKVLGALALVWPGLPRLKEWAYAGVFFLMTGAAVSHAVCGETGHVIAPVVLAVLGMVSWVLRPSSRRLGIAEEETVGNGMPQAVSVRAANL
jgi:uncharacterized membrane protein YphA (DoxX/SURF4 family)